MNALTLFYTISLVLATNANVLYQKQRQVGDCPSISVKNGRVRYRQKGRVAKFVCNNGFMLVGQRFSVCSLGKWEDIPPKCVKPNCSPVKAPPNILIFTSYLGAVINFYCKSGYTIKGPQVAHCLGSKWDNQLPTCQATNVKPQMHCDFETEDLCGWTHDLNHDFEWIRLSNETPSHRIGTGPSFDHTKGQNQDGYYMYIESSSKDVNDTARLLSPIYDHKPNTSTCFEFWYHMYGQTTGELRVYLKYLNDSWNLDVNQAFFRKVGNQGDVWYRSITHLGQLKDDYQIIIEGVRGSSYVSDIAIDDVAIIENCPDFEEEMTSTSTDFSSTDQAFSVETCENRCGLNDTGDVISNAVLTCDCDDSCWDRNRCCPDYLDTCMGTTLGDLGESSTRSTAVTTIRTTTSSARTAVKLTTTIKTTVKLTTPKVTTIKRTTPKSTTVKLTTPKSTTVKLTTPKVTTVKLTTHKATTVKLTTPKVTTAKLTTSNATQKALITDIETAATSKPTTVNVDLSNDIDSEWDDSASPELIQHEKESEKILTDKITVAKASTPHQLQTIIFVLGVGAGVLIMAAILAIVTKKLRQRQRRFNHRTNGDSASDVRFLTADEVLDLSIRDYDDDL